MTRPIRMTPRESSVDTVGPLIGTVVLILLIIIRVSI